MRHFPHVIRVFGFILSVSIAALPQQSGQPAQDPGGSDAAAAPAAAPPAPMSVQVIYTGNMFGYFRLPDEQTDVDKSCPTTSDPGGIKPNPEGQALVDALEAYQKTSVVVGMGENFTPELLSRTMTYTGATRPLDHTTIYKGDKRPRDLFTFDYLQKPEQQAWLLDEELEDNQHDNLLAEIARGHGRIPVDNVACLLSYAGYTAIVPGKHDFYFGPEYLRYLARLLASPKDGTPYSPVQMLAANLVIQTTVKSAAKRTPFRDKTGMRYSDDPGNIEFEFSDGDAILPWVRYIKVTVTKPESGPFLKPEFLICPAVDNSDPDDADVPGWHIDRHEPCANLDLVNGNKNGEAKKDGTEKNATKKNDAKDDKKPKPENYRLPKDFAGHTFLMPNRNYLLCATNVNRGSSKESRPYCQHLSVYSPFFYYPYLIPAPGQPLNGFTDGQEPRFRNPMPYVLKNVTGNDGTKTNVAIFGVVDPDINEHIGKLNYAWLNDETDAADNLTLHKSYSTEAKAMEPVTALKQQLEYFREVQTGDPLKPQFDGIKILLAQMPAYKARLLAAAMKGEFNLVIAQAEFEEATPYRTDTTKIPPDALPARAGPEVKQCGSKSNPCTFTAPTFVAVPAPFFEDTYRDRMQLQLRKASIVRKQGCGSDNPDCFEEWSFDNRLLGLPGEEKTKKEPCPQVQLDTIAPCALRGQPQQALFAVDDFKQRIRNGLQESRYHDHDLSGVWEPDKALQKFRQLVLLVMQKHADTDVALLQKRDFFAAYVDSGVVPNSNNVQEMLDRILWKGDFLLKIPVRGDVLKKIMERSKQFDADDKSSLSPAHETNRGLVTLGIFFDRTTGSYIVNGEILDESKLYTAATSDYLGLGDTGYSDLLTPPVGKPLTPSDIDSVRYISGLVCQEMARANSGFDVKKCRQERIDADEYFASLEHRPFDNTRGFTPLRHLISWAKIQKRRPPLYPSNKVDGTERSFQERPLWDINLSKLAVGFTMNQHNHGSESNLASLFGGITTVPVVSAANSNTTTLDSSLRVQFNSGPREFFAQTDASYTRQLTRQNDANNTDLATQLKNQFAFETGILPRLYPRSKEIPGLKELISFRVETQLANPLTNFKLGTGGVLPFIADRTQTVLGKYGLRFQNQKSWIESGYQAGELIASPTGFLFNPPITNPLAVTCTASSAKRSLAKCIKDNSGAAGKITATSQVVEFTRNHFEHGLFLNFKMNMPLPGNDKLVYVMENKGQLFFNRGGDLSVETKLYEDWTHSLVVPLFGNFSFVPKVEIIAFQNKVDNSFFWTWQPTLSVQYSFDWHNGLSLKHAFAYQNPQVASKAALSQ